MTPRIWVYIYNIVMRRGKLIKLKQPKLADFYKFFASRPEVHWLSVVALFVAISRWLGHMRFLYLGDSVNYALALDRYDLTLHQPHPPGYALYILLAKPVYWLVGDANLALIIVGILLSMALVYAIFYLAKAIYGRRVAWVAVFLMMSSPPVWFYGQVALNYLSDALFASLLALFVYHSLTETKSVRWLTWASIVFALGGGFRPTLMVFLATLWLWAVLRRKSFKILLGQAGIIIGMTLAWLLPAVYLSGGFLKVWHSVYSLVFDKSALYSFSVFTSGWKALSQYSGALLNNLLLGLGLGMAAVVMFLVYLITPRADVLRVNYRNLTFWSLWLLPPLLFYLLVVFTIPGYLLIILPAIIVLVAKALDEVINGMALALVHSPRLRPQAVLGATIAATILITGFNIFRYCRPVGTIVQQQKPTHGSISALDHLWDSLLPTIRREFNPQSTVIGVDKPFMAWGLSHFQYYLPEYMAYQRVFWGMYNPEGMYWYRTYNRQRKLVKTLDLTSLDTKFIIIREQWGGDIKGLYSRIPILRTDNNLGDILYYDLTDPAVRELMPKIEHLQLEGATIEQESSPAN